MISGESFDVIFKKLCYDAVRIPEYECSPRGQKIRENLVQSFRLNDPRARLVNNPARATNMGFAVGEFLWYWQGKQDLETMLYYNKRMKNFSDDGKTLNSAYGHRLRQSRVTPDSQWEVAISTLLKDPDSRRAVLLINEPADEWTADVHGSKDVPCTLSLQFFIREDQLHLHAVMRSNDVMWGLTYDLFSFTLFQECMLLELQMRGMKDLRLGKYYHTAGSLHVYEPFFEMAEKVAFSEIGPWAHEGMPDLTNLSMLNELCEDEENLRLGKIQTIDLGKYQGGERWMASALNAHRTRRDAEKR